MSLTPVGILIFDDVEVLDFCGPFEVFSLACKPGEDTYPDNSLFRVHTVAASPEPIRTVGGMQVVPSCTIDDHPPFEILVVPGGYGTRTLYEGDDRVTAWIARERSGGTLTTSVCTGAFLLARAGLLEGKRATTHWGSIDNLRRRHPEITVLDDLRVVDEGEIVTAAGVSAGIDMALHVVARLHGVQTAINTAREMEYRWEPPQ
ncbi:MAG: DJ-1/PfpI family protein [Chloroflexota bacterium]|nr:DJ-1/PfpI family protein [Chloroflexota bacterium]